VTAIPKQVPLERDLAGFEEELRALKAEVVASLGPEDLEHLQKLERWGRWSTLAGYATAWTLPNPITMALLSTGSMAQWTILAHHVLHKGMDQVPGAPERLTSKGFAKGLRRWIDWPDWIVPDAWSHEHNVLHHAYTNEVADPDLVEVNLRALRAAKVPKLAKHLAVAWFALTWKLSYYAPNTLQVLGRKRDRTTKDIRSDGRGDASLLDGFDPRNPEGRALWLRSILPYGLGRFVAVPALFAPLGPWAVFSVLVNSVGAELLTNLHTFAIITPNHAGDDLERFDGPPTGKGEWFARQVKSSANFTTGGDLNDFLHGFLNYQIEHHLFPDLPPRQYQRIQPRVKAICEKYGVPYVQEPLWKRVQQLWGVAVGDRTMRAGVT
jgi:fatty acid desaturase